MARLTNDRRLPVATFDPVREDHIWLAVQSILSGQVQHSFGESTDYDVIANDQSRLPPKAVFGVAASEALGIDIRPWHFTGGLNTRCFKAINDAGYRIVPKGEGVGADELPRDPEERIWAEGSQVLVTHLRRERASGISRAKKRAFKREHGRLFCERCKLEPQEIYGSEIGNACIEVHHDLPLGAEPTVRDTKLQDLKCVCANCHRIIHYELRKNLKQPKRVL